MHKHDGYKGAHHHALVYFECVKTLLKTKLKLFKRITIVSFEILFFNKSIYCFLFLCSFDIWYALFL